MFACLWLACPAAFDCCCCCVQARKCKHHRNVTICARHGSATVDSPDGIDKKYVPGLNGNGNGNGAHSAGELQVQLLLLFNASHVQWCQPCCHQCCFTLSAGL